MLCLFVADAAGATECTHGSENGMLSRVVAVDLNNGTLNGQPNARSAVDVPPPLALNDKELVLTFDQGPHPMNTEYILYTLDRFCAKAVFFFTGSTALANAAVVREVAQRGHTVAAGPWSASVDIAALPLEEAKLEIEKGLTAVTKAAGEPVAPFFRVAGAAPGPEVLRYLQERGISLWSYDIASGDNEPGLAAGQFFNRFVAKIRETGKGVVQFHDTSKITVNTLDDILLVAKQSGFKIVQLVPAASFAPKEEYVASLPTPVLEAHPMRTIQSLVKAPKHRVRARSDAEPHARRPVGGRQPEN